MKLNKGRGTTFPYDPFKGNLRFPLVWDYKA